MTLHASKERAHILLNSGARKDGCFAAHALTAHSAANYRARLNVPGHMMHSVRLSRRQVTLYLGYAHRPKAGTYRVEMVRQRTDMG